MSSEYDIDIEDYIKPEPPQLKCLEYVGTGGWLFFGGRRGGGKLSPLNSKVCTPKGWRKIGDLKIGDTITCPSTGGTQKVIAIHPQGKKDIYKVTFDDTATCLVGLEHLWAYKRPNKQRPGTKRSSERQYAIDVLGADIEENRWHNLRVGTTKEIMGLLELGENPRIPLTEPVIYTVNGNTGHGFTDPYILGLYLGDGHLATHTITNTDKEIIDYCVKAGFSYKVEEGVNLEKYSLYPTKDLRTAYDRWFRKHNLLHCRAWEKFIPEYVFTSSLEYRIHFLQGLLDSDGYVDERGRCYYYTTSPKLRDGFIEIMQSLGGKCYVQVKENPTYNHKGETKFGRTSYGVLFQIRKTSSMFRLTRKKMRCTDSWNGGYENMRAIMSIEKVSNEEAVCITVDHPLGLYLTDDFVVTHNSWLARASTMIVCHRYPGIVCCIIRATESELKGNFIDKFPLEYPEDIFGYIVKSKDRELKFDNGSKVVFRPLRDQKDAEKIQGLEYQYIVIDEANNFDIEVINKIKASLRSSMGNDFIPTLLMTGNPGGYNDLYFKTRYVQPDYSVWRPEELEFKHKYVFIESKTSDNPYLTKEYYDNLKTQSDKMRRAWLDGDWNAFEGQFFDEFDINVHYIDEFDVPKHWRVVGCMDLGYTVQHPTVCYWLAQDPETLKVYVIREYVNVGAIKTYCADIKEINNRFFNTAIIYADPSMWSNNTKREESDTSPANYFISEGVPLMPAKNDRVNGWRMLKLWMHHKQGEGSMLYIFKSCPKLAETLPLLKHAVRNGTEIEDMDSRGPDDAADALRYGIYTAFDYPSNAEKQYRSETYSELRRRPDFDENAHNIYSYCDRKYASALATF